MDRNIVDVIERIKAEIPESETSLHSDLEHIKYSSLFTAPEVMVNLWHKLSITLEYGIQDHESDWAQKVARIVRAEE